jgi:alanine dehydrogenase
MIIGVPRERKTLEQRVALTPDGARELIHDGHTVLIETNAGQLSFFTDEAYKAAGATIVTTLRELWTTAEMIVKVKEPHPEEYEFFRPGLLLFDYLHLAGLPDVAKELVKSKVTGIAYELVQTDTGRMPLLEPMSEVAGKLSVLNGAYFLLAQNGGRGVLLGGAVGVPAGNVVIAGAGIAGRAATAVAAGMGARVSVLDVNYLQLDRIRSEFQSTVQTEYSTESTLLRCCSQADLVISAVLVPGARAPQVFTEEIIRAMPRGSVFVDISIDQGGSAATSRATSLEEPTYVEHGVIHYAVPNMPAQTARTSTQALTAATLPYIRKIAGQGLRNALKGDVALSRALNTFNGNITNPAVAAVTDLPYLELESALNQIN